MPPFLKTVWIAEVRNYDGEWEALSEQYATEAEALAVTPSGPDWRARGVFADDPDARAAYNAEQAQKAVDAKIERDLWLAARRPYECGVQADCGANCVLEIGHDPDIEHTCRTDGEECPA